MTALRRRLVQHRALAGWLVALALLLKLVVPTGYMLDMTGGSARMEICTGYGPMAAAIPMAMPGMKHHGKADGHGKAEQPCAFAGLTAPSLGAIDPILLAMAFAVVVAAAFRSVPRLPIRPAGRLRPPLRGPPGLA